MVGDMYIIKSQLYGVNGNMHDWHIYPEMGGGMLYDWGVHLIDQMLDMVKSKIVSLYADVHNVINENVDDYFKIIMKFENGVTAEIELVPSSLLVNRKDHTILLTCSNHLIIFRNTHCCRFLTDYMFFCCVRIWK